MATEASDTLHAAVQDAIGRSQGPRFWDWPNEDFNLLARRLFAYQFASCAPFAHYCWVRGVEPNEALDWTEIPPVPTEIFKTVDLFAASAPADAGLVFQTSGTTEGTRGRHYLRHAETYEASLGPWLEAFLIPSGGRPRVVVLAPTQAQAPDSSLSHMLQWAHDRCGGKGSAFFWDGSGPRIEEAYRALQSSCEEACPVLLLGTARAVQALLEYILDGVSERALNLPQGSGLMETGGFKGASSSLSPDSLREGLSDALGLPSEAVVSEYGMTELGSQGYQPSLRMGADPETSARFGPVLAQPGGPEGLVDAFGVPRLYAFPPWCRVRAVEPSSLEILPMGKRGLLCFWDLSNVDSVLCVQTADLGVVLPEGVVLYGRAPGAPPRGCSLAVDEILRGRSSGEGSA